MSENVRLPEHRVPQDPWLPPRNRPTAPRRKTAERLVLQEAMGWPSTSKLVISGGTFMHPTKGLRKHSHGRGITVKPSMRLPAPRRHRRTELQDAVERMSNWRRSIWSKCLSAAKRENMRQDDKQRLAMANAILRVRHSEWSL